MAEIIVEHGKAAWPTVPFSVNAVARQLAGASLTECPECPADLCLALACADGVPAALQVFERQLLSEVAAFVARIDSSPAFADEVKQRLRERLLVGPAPKIAEYAGRGPLGAWLRVAAVRVALDLRRGRKSVPAVTVSDVAARALDPELRVMRAEHRAAFQDALRLRLGGLSPRERNVLRMYFANGWSLERIGKSYRVHKTTVARWLAAIRERLLREMIQDMGDRLGLDAKELRSLAGLLRSQIDASLTAIQSRDGAQRSSRGPSAPAGPHLTRAGQ